MFGIYGYLAAFVAVAALLGGTYYKGDQDGRASIRLEWDAANAKAIQENEASRQATENASRQGARTLETQLAKTKEVNRALLTAVEAHIRAASAARPAGCPAPVLSDELWNDWARAANPAASPASGVLPATVRTGAAKPD